MPQRLCEVAAKGLRQSTTAVKRRELIRQGLGRWIIDLSLDRFEGIEKIIKRRKEGDPLARRVLMVYEACALPSRHRGSLPQGALDPPEYTTAPRAPASPGTRAKRRSKHLSSEAPGQRSGKTRSPIRSAARSSTGWSNRSDRRALHARNAMARTVFLPAEY